MTPSQVEYELAITLAAALAEGAEPASATAETDAALADLAAGDNPDDVWELFTTGSYAPQR